jgi:hypothetical protein
MTELEQTDPVVAVTAALVDARLAFQFSPFQERALHSAAWLLEFEDGQEERLWLDDDDEHLVLAAFLRSTCLREGESPRELDDGIWLTRVPPSSVVAMTWLPLSELDYLKERVYELLDAVRLEERQASAKHVDKRSARKAKKAPARKAKRAPAKKT